MIRSKDSENIKANSLWDSLLEYSDDVIFVINQDQLITDINKKGVELLGMDRDEILTRPCHSLFFDSENPTDCLRIFKENKNIFFNKFNKTFKSKVSPVKENGSIKYYIIQLSKTHGEALIESEEKYNLIANFTSDLIWVMGTDLSIQYVSPSSEKFIGYSPQELKEIGWRHIHTAEPFGRIVAMIRENIILSKSNKSEAKTQYKFEVEYIHKDGHKFPAEVKANLLFDDKGKAIAVSGISRDISDQRKSELALRESEEKYRILFEKSDDAISIIEGNKFIDCNNAVIKLLGLRHKEEVLNMHPSEVSPEFQPDGSNSFKKAEEMMKIALDKSVNHFEWIHQRANGELFPAEIWLATIPFKEKKIIQAIWRDITERKKAEKALIENEENINLFFNTIEAFLIIIDFNGKIMKVNKTLVDQLGYSEGELMKLKVYDILPKNRKDSIEANIKMVLDGKLSSFSLPWVSKNGQIISTDLRVNKSTWEGRPVIFGVAMDYSAKESYHIISKSPVVLMLWRKDENWTVEFVSENVENIFGYTVDDFVGDKLPYASVIHPHDIERCRKEVREFTAKNLTSFEHQPYRIITKSGEVKWVSDVTNIRQNKKNNLIYYEGIITDITARMEMELALASSEKQYRDLFDYSPFPMIVHQKGKTVMVNKSALDFFEVKTKEQGIGLSILDFIHKDDLDLVIQNTKQISETGNQSKKREYKLKTFAKKTKYAESIGFPILYKGKPAIHAVFNDTTEKRKAEIKLRESEEKFRNVVEQAGDGILIGNTKGEVIDMNKSFLQMTGYSKEDVFEKPISILYQKKELIEKPLRFDLLNIGKSVITERGIISKSGKTIPVEMNSKKLGTIGYIAIIRDLTERKKAEKKLKKQNREYAELNKQYLKQNKALIKAKNKAIESDRLKSAFLANMSHEIRTPMNGIIGFCDMLGTEHLEPEDQREYIQIITQSSYQLLNIVNDILDISKIETGQVEFQPGEVCINHLINDVMNEFMPYVDMSRVIINKSINLNDEKSTITTDIVKIKQVFNNLVSNAVKFTEDGEITIGYELKGSFLEFFVKDTGLGIDKELHSKIFERFVQADLTITDPQSGTGLGLAIAKANTELAGGEIWIESESGQGTTFFFTIPYHPVVKPILKSKLPENKAAGEDYDFKGKTILVVEDEMANFKFLEIVLKRTGAQIFHAILGRRSVEWVQEHPELDLVLMDIKLPDINGYEATRMIKAYRKNIPVIAQTAFAMAGDEVKAKEAGCDGYISKPIEALKLLELLHGFLN